MTSTQEIVDRLSQGDYVIVKSDGRRIGYVKRADDCRRACTFSTYGAARKVAQALAGNDKSCWYEVDLLENHDCAAQIIHA